jgi:hypothetical protein
LKTCRGCKYYDIKNINNIELSFSLIHYCQKHTIEIGLINGNEDPYVPVWCNKKYKKIKGNLEIYSAGIYCDYEGKDWREYLTFTHPEIDWIHPENVADKLAELKELYEKGDRETNDVYMKYQINSDLNRLERSDAILVKFLSTDGRTIGTVCEMFYAWRTGKPVYMWTDLRPTQMSNWELAMIKHKDSDVHNLISTIKKDFK